MRSWRPPATSSKARERSACTLAAGEERRAERLHFRQTGVAEPREAEDLLDRGQQRKVIIGFLCQPTPLLDEGRKQQQPHLPSARPGESGCAGGRRQVGKARLVTARARVGVFAARGSVVGCDREQSVLLVSRRG